MLERQLDELRAAARAHLEADSIADTCDARERLKELL
jgi:hypothetical protein